MSEERTQAPTRRRRQQARERGHVARSSDLTSGAGLLAAVVLIGAFGEALTLGLIGAIRAPLERADLTLTLSAGAAKFSLSSVFDLVVFFGVIALPSR